MIALPAPLEVSPATPSDAAFEQTLYRSTRADLLELDAAPAVIEQLLAMQWQIHRAGMASAFPNIQSWIIQRKTQPIGHFVVATQESGWHLLELILLPQERGQGLGRQVMRQLQHCAAAAGLALTLRVAKNNTAARQLYISLGFVSREENPALDFMSWPA